MMAGFADQPVVERTFVEASEILGTDLWALANDGPTDAQNQTVNTQPLMLVAGVACYRAWIDHGGSLPAVFAGHSLGEYTALVAAGALSFADALTLVKIRAVAMQEAVPEGVGGIAAVLGLDADAVRAVCAEAAEGYVLDAVNLNSPGQVVIAGHRNAVERGIVLAKARGAKRAMMLPMSVPSHCALMKPAAERVADAIKHIDVTVPTTPVIQNADVVAHTSSEAIKQALVEQLYRPVRWIETVQAIAAMGVVSVIECVPGKVLTGLNKRIDVTLQCHAVTGIESLLAAIVLTQKGTH